MQNSKIKKGEKGEISVYDIGYLGCLTDVLE